MIIINEYKYVEDNFLKEGFKITKVWQLFLLIRYYADMGYSLQQTKNAIVEFDAISQISTIANDMFLFSGAYTKATMRKIRKEDCFWITEYELEIINSIEDVEDRKVYLALLVLRQINNNLTFSLTFADLKKISLTQKTVDEIKNSLFYLSEKDLISIIDWRVVNLHLDVKSLNQSENVIALFDEEHLIVPYLQTLNDDVGFYCAYCGRYLKYSRDDLKLNNHKIRKYCEKCKKLAKNKKPKTLK